MHKKLLFTVVILAFLALVTKGLGLFSGTMFGFHDITQAGRVHDFILSIQNGHIPPRIAANFSHGMGYPVFNFYAPFAYWITSVFVMLSVSIPMAIKLSFLSALITAGVGMFMFLRERYSDSASFFGAVLYASSPYMALEIFVRGNLSELWLLALLPLLLSLMHKASANGTRIWYIIVALVFSFMLTSHNVLSLVGALIVGLYAYILPDMKRMWKYLLAGLVAASYFFIPALTEIHRTYAADVAALTSYAEHFVCPAQLWNSLWAYGGSTEGCIDGMSFQLGKLLIVSGFTGVALYIFSLVKKAHDHKPHKILMMGILFISLFLALPLSAPLWSVFEPFLKLFQFPWRFLGFTIFGLAFFAGYAIDRFLQKKYVIYIMVAILLTALYMNADTFRPNPDTLQSTEDYQNTYITDEYLAHEIAYRIPEYLPKSADYEAWLAARESEGKPSMEPVITLDGQFVTVMQDDPFVIEAVTSSRGFLINKHYMPYWSISINDSEIIPNDFDEFGRPRIISNNAWNAITVRYQQTPIEYTANALSLSAYAVLCAILIQELWKRKN